MTNQHTFSVSQVQPSEEAPVTTDVHHSIEQYLGGAVESCSTPDELVVKPYGFHVLMETLHRAFDEHRSLVLSPDHIWLTISQGFAACINQDPERYRSMFVGHAGKETIIIRRDSFVLGDFHNDWQSCFPEFSQVIRDYIGNDTHELILSDFTTTGAIERAASEVELMDTVQNYFEYEVHTKCGIPSITLEGTVADWQKVVSKTKALAAFGGLDWWLDKVIPVVEEFANAAAGNADMNFWQGIYKGKDQSGGISATGYLLRLLPYVKDWSGNAVKNGLVSGQSTYGLDTSLLPQALSCVPFVWDYLGTRLDYQFLAGLVGIAHNQCDDSLRPVVGWAVRPAGSNSVK